MPEWTYFGVYLDVQVKRSTCELWPDGGQYSVEHKVKDTKSIRYKNKIDNQNIKI
jgi:hypothetical protein